MVDFPVKLVRCLILASALVTGSLASQRVWEFTSGEKITANYVWSDRQTLYLRDPAGKDLTRPVGLLSNADLEFVRAIHARLRAEGILREVPLTWESFHSKNVKALDAQESGAYPLDSKPNAMGKLELEFKPLGSPPRVDPGHTAVLRLTTSKHGAAGTKSALHVIQRGRIVGSATNIAANSTFDIPLPSQIFDVEGAINFTLRCGPDTVYLRTAKSGAGPRLLIIASKEKGGSNGE